MQTLKANTPVQRCLMVAGYSASMLGKFPESARLADLSQRMKAGAQELAGADSAYKAAAAEMVAMRVNVTFENHAADQRIRRTCKLAEIADGRKNGRIASLLFASGASSITRLLGESQISAMKDLEARLDTVKDLWPEALAEKAAIAEHRSRYEAALQSRKAKQEEVRALRAARDAARERFVHLYAEIASLVKAEYPRDRMAQELFFMAVNKAPSGQEDADDDLDVDDESEEGDVVDESNFR